MASNSKKRRRVLRVSCILAALIIAGSSFAWFTSKDEVTNRLSANADYDVSIVESYAPPKNFLPGQKVNKDVYATNTGSIGAFVEEKVTTRISVVDEVDTYTTWGKKTVQINGIDVEVDTGVIATNKESSGASAKSIAIADCVELTKDEYYSVEAGSYLAYKPYDSTATLGDIIVHYPDASLKAYINKTDYTDVITKEAYDALLDKSNYIEVKETLYKPKTAGEIIDEEAYKLKTDAEKADYVKMSFKDDFTPDANGLYVFRRSIDTMTNGGEFFTYEGYYFQDGKYYKVNNIVVTPDNLLDFVYDGENTDGQLTTATANLVYEKKETVAPTLTYDAAKNRLVATYERGYDAATLQNTLEAKAKALDEAEHDLAVARAQLQRALQDSAASDANVAKYTNSVTQLENELEATKARIAELESLIGYQPNSTNSTTPDKTGIEKQIEDQTTAKDNAESALNSTTASAEGALTLLYGTGTGKNTFTADANGDYKADFNDQASNYSVDGANGTTVMTQALATAAKNATSEDALYYKYLKAMADLKDLKDSYGNDMFSAYVAELKEHFKNNTDILNALNAANSFDDVVAIPELKWDDFETITFVGTGDYTAEHLHRVNEYTYKLMKAKEAYDEQKAKADSELAKYTKAVKALGTAGSTATNANAGTDVKKDAGTTTVPYNTYTVSGESGLEGEKARLKAELDEAKAKKEALLTAIGAELTNADNAQTVGGNNDTAAENLAASKTEYNNAYAAYKKALDEYNNADEAYKQRGDLKIYINLSDDVVTYGGVADKWQMLPVDTVNDYNNTTLAATPSDNKNDTAYFYWTGILQGGETSKKLIDSVELDKDTTQDMYKSFDFDIDVSMKSAQVTYDEAGNVLATAVNKDTSVNPAFNGELDADVAITDPANEKTTALTWTAKP